VARAGTNLFLFTARSNHDPVAMWSWRSEFTFFNTNDLAEQFSKALDVRLTIVTYLEFLHGSFATSEHDVTSLTNHLRYRDALFLTDTLQLSLSCLELLNLSKVPLSRFRLDL
jgi:hypothetical protein